MPKTNDPIRIDIASIPGSGSRLAAMLDTLLSIEDKLAEIIRRTGDHQAWIAINFGRLDRHDR